MALCFKDREFCSAACTNTLCLRNLNDAVHAEAQRWWGDLPGGPPIAMRDMSRGCEHYQPAVVAEA